MKLGHIMAIGFSDDNLALEALNLLKAALGEQISSYAVQILFA